jgi:hypothetical protein
MNSAEQVGVLAGRYQLGPVIGHGGMGTVWRARDILLERDVAVKEIVWPSHFTEAEGETARRRAVREAQMAARLNHPNVVGIYDIVEEDGRPWIVMELVPYRSLRDIVTDDGPLSPARATEVGLGVLAALRAAHAEGVLHRDVKPANILVGPDDRVVLTDFGIARAANSAALTTSGVLVGSPSYISPERARGEQAGPPADLWGLGASLYTAVEGRPPFERDGVLASLTAVVADDPVPSVHAGPLLPVITGLLRKDPDQRLNAAQTERMLREVAAATQAAPASEPVPAAEPPFAEAPVPAPAPAPAPSRDAPLAHRRRSRFRLAWLAAAVVVVAAGAVAAAIALSGAPPGHATAAPPTSGTTTRHPSARPSTPARMPTATPSPATTSSGSSASPKPGGTYGALPAGYYRFTNSTGFSIGVPHGWRISHQGHYVYVTDPANSGVYLLIDQSDHPKPNALADWKQQQTNRASGYQDYHLIRLQPVDYPQAQQAADWEFTYDRDGVTVHILNRNVLANSQHAYALYWSVPESDWTADYHYFQAFAATFRPAS